MGAGPRADRAVAISKEWGIPSFLTEMYDCNSWNVTNQLKVGHLFYQYSPFCNTGPDFSGYWEWDQADGDGRKIVKRNPFSYAEAGKPGGTFGACILGWD